MASPDVVTTMQYVIAQLGPLYASTIHFVNTLSHTEQETFLSQVVVLDNITNNHKRETILSQAPCHNERALLWRVDPCLTSARVALMWHVLGRRNDLDYDQERWRVWWSSRTDLQIRVFLFVFVPILDAWDWIQDWQRIQLWEQSLLRHQLHLIQRYGATILYSQRSVQWYYAGSSQNTIDGDVDVHDLVGYVDDDVSQYIRLYFRGMDEFTWSSNDDVRLIPIALIPSPNQWRVNLLQATLQHYLPTVLVRVIQALLIA